MKFENTKVMNFEGAFRGLRNPKNSWSRSDSLFGNKFDPSITPKQLKVIDKWIENKHPNLDKESLIYEIPFLSFLNWFGKNGIIDSKTGEIAYLGPNDLTLAQNLIKAGSEHRKFLRQIFVSVDITAPRFWWSEADTYKIGTTSDSTSTMHKLADTPITMSCFEREDSLYSQDVYDGYMITESINNLIDFCEMLRTRYNETGDKRYWKELVRWLPQSWLQTRTWTANYEVLLSMINQRKNHKLKEWSVDFIEWCEHLPYARELLFLEN